jgi:hypothetical protein
VALSFKVASTRRSSIVRRMVTAAFSSEGAGDVSRVAVCWRDDDDKGPAGDGELVTAGRHGQDEHSGGSSS